MTMTTGDDGYRARRVAVAAVVRRWAAVLVLTATAMVAPGIGGAVANADPCSDVEVIFARGTNEPPGVGATGQAFTDALTARLPGKSVDIYPVDYPASLDFSRAADGVVDASNKITSVVAACPQT